MGFTTEDPAIRLLRHNESYYENKFTAKGKPWSLFLSIPCQNINQARSIEAHIKKMKSKKYLQNLKAFPEIMERLKAKFP